MTIIELQYLRNKHTHTQILFLDLLMIAIHKNTGPVLQDRHFHCVCHISIGNENKHEQNVFTVCVSVNR